MLSALMIIDVQQGMFDVSPVIHRGDEVLWRIAGLLARARAGALPIVHVRDDGGPGHVLAKGSAGWAFHPLVEPRPNEIVIDKQHSSSFHDTDLHSRLADAGVERLVIAGMQTEMCVDAACRGAVALGYRVVLVADGHTTWDTPLIDAERIIAEHNRLLGSCFADVVAADKVQF